MLESDVGCVVVVLLFVECIKDKRLSSVLLMFTYYILFTWSSFSLHIKKYIFSFILRVVLWHHKKQIIAPCSLYFLVAVIPETSRLL